MSRGVVRGVFDGLLVHDPRRVAATPYFTGGDFQDFNLLRLPGSGSRLAVWLQMSRLMR
jgi:hypothetical protein